jgi:hypothetical protein
MKLQMKNTGINLLNDSSILKLHSQNNQKNGAHYLHGKLDTPTPPKKMNPISLMTKMNTTEMKNHYHLDNPRPETNHHHHLLLPNLPNKHIAGHDGSTIADYAK